MKKPIEVILNVQYTTTTKTESAWVEDGNGQKQVKSEIKETTFTSADSTTQQGIKVQYCHDGSSSDLADHRQEEKSRVIQTDNLFVISSMDAAKLL